MSDNTNGARANGKASGNAEALQGLLDGLEKMPDGVRRAAMRMTANALMSRAQMIEGLTQQDRDLDTDCGYPKGPIASQLYQEMYDREPIPARVVELFPNECWQVSPSVYESEEADVETEFEKAWDDLGQMLRPEESWHSGESGSVVWEYLHRLDVISGIGQYGVMLLGLDDGRALDQPVDGSGPRKLLFARVFPETLARIAAIEADPRSPRFGQPTFYDITFAAPAGTASTYSITGGNPGAVSSGSGIGSNPDAGPGASGLVSGITTSLVHWTRVLHAADNRRENEVYGVPRQQQVLNRLLDLRKLYGGSAEMYWKGAFPGIALETWPQLGWDVDIDEEKTRDMMWRYQNSLQRYLQLTGQSAKPLSPQVVDPSGQIDKHIESICIKLGCPVRIFKGSERGELASTQDDAAWNDRIKQRCGGYVTPRLVVPFVDRLINLRVLPQPEQYFVWWPDLTSKSDDERATIASQRTTAIVAYSGAPNGPTTIAPIDYWTRIQGFSDEEAQSIVDNAEAEKERIQKEQEAQAKARADQAQQEHDRQLALMAAGDPGATQPPAPGAPGSQTDPALPPGNIKGSRGTGGGGITPPRAAPAAVPPSVGNFDPSQPRDKGGRWNEGAGAGTQKSTSARLSRKDITSDDSGASVASTTEKMMEVAASRVASHWHVSDHDLHALLKEEGVAKEFAGRQGLGLKRDAAEYFIRQWASSSGHPVAVAAINSVATSLGLKGKLSPSQKESVDYVGGKPELARAAYSFGKAIYKTTQDWLAARGISELEVHRVGGPSSDRLFSSWSASYGGVRADSQRQRVSAAVPSKYVFSMAGTGFGTLHEMEVVILPRDQGTAAAQNWDPSQARDTIGRFASGGAGASSHRADVLRSAGQAAGGLAFKGLKSAVSRATKFAKAVGARASHLEHLAKAMLVDKVTSAVGKLPTFVQVPVLAAYKIGRVGTAAAFATWTAGQAMAEKVAKERGMSTEEARSFRGVLSSFDVLSFKPLSLGLHFTGMHATGLGLVGMIPPASAGYLAYSTAKNPAATLRAARGVIRDTIKKLSSKKEKPVSGNYDDGREVSNAAREDVAHGNASLVADALEEHGYDDWYIALLSIAIDETDDVARAIKVASTAYEEMPEVPASKGGSVWDELGLTREQALASLNVEPTAPSGDESNE